jgi:hypothetical protein
MKWHKAKSISNAYYARTTRRGLKEINTARAAIGKSYAEAKPKMQRFALESNPQIDGYTLETRQRVRL